MTREEAEEVAKEAAKQRGQDWNALPGHSRDIWIEAARNDELSIQKQEQADDGEPIEDEPENGETDEAENGPKPKAKRGKK